MSTVGQIPPPYVLANAYRQAFGYARPPFPLLVAESNNFGALPTGTIIALNDSFTLKSTLGVDYTMPTKLDDWQMPNEPTLSVRGGKRVIDTPITRLDPKSGKIERKNVLEEVSLNNYEIRLRGTIFNEDDFDSYPETEMRRLREIIEKPGSRAISNSLLNIFNIGNVAIIDCDFFEIRGYAGAQAYELHLLADENLSLELELNEPERS